MNCPHCGVSLTVELRDKPRTTACPKCQGKVSIPALPAEVQADAGVSLSPGAASDGVAATGDAGEDKILYEEHPSMFRNAPVKFVLGILACLVLVGIPFMVAWWMKTLATTLIVTESKVIFRKGILSKYTNEIMLENIRNVQLSQTFWQRVLGTGWIGISSSGQSGIEISINGIPHPETVKELIDKHRED